jgi:chromosome partitioning protein
LTIPTQNALAVSTHYVLPVSPDFLSAIGIALLTTRFKEFAEQMDHKITLADIVFSRVGRPARKRSETIVSIREQFKEMVLESELKERVSVAEAAEEARSIFQSNDRNAISEFSNI